MHVFNEENTVECDTRYFLMIYCNMFKRLISFNDTLLGSSATSLFFPYKELSLKKLVAFEDLIKDLISWQAC